MWYETDKPRLRVREDRPIFATGGDSTFILLPQLRADKTYTIIGYNWFNIRSGTYNSCACYETIEDAMKAYSSYTISNGALQYMM